MEPNAVAERWPEAGLAGLIALIGLTFLGLFGFFLSLQTTTELRVSDNYESHVRARYAALAGISHSRVLLRGLAFDDILLGPDGVCDASPGYRTSARFFGFRNPVSWVRARFIRIDDPAADLAGIPDDGLINTGRVGGAGGVVLIPLTGIALPFGPGAAADPAILARYFVRVTDNNGEASELAADPADDPFDDGDGTVILRSMGLASAMREAQGSVFSQNSVTVFELRLRRLQCFSLDAPLVVQGNAVQSSSGQIFGGSSFFIQGGDSNPGLGTIDIDPGDATRPDEVFRASLPGAQYGNISGRGIVPSISDLTSDIQAHADKSLLLSSNYLQSFVGHDAPKFADNVYSGNQRWIADGAPDIGHYDPALAPNAPSQRPKVTLVDGDLFLAGPVEGAGLLIVTGKLALSGDFTFNGIILVLGAGDIDIAISGNGVRGGIYVAAFSGPGGATAWQIPRVSIGGNTVLSFNRGIIEMAVRLIPPLQSSFREVTSTMDP